MREAGRPRGAGLRLQFFTTITPLGENSHKRLEHYLVIGAEAVEHPITDVERIEEEIRVRAARLGGAAQVPHCADEGLHPSR